MDIKNNKIIAIVGLCGAGKSEVSEILKSHNFGYIRFGQITMDILKEKNEEVNEKNERKIREEIRAKHGMSAYAILNLPKIEELLKNRHVIIDGLYSWEEYLFLKEKFEERLIVVCVYTTKKMRYSRLINRKIRPLTKNDAISRDHAQIEKLHQGGPIAIADYLIKNDKSLEDLKNEVNKILIDEKLIN